MIDVERLNKSLKYQTQMIFYHPQCINQITTFLGPNYLSVVEIAPTAENYLKFTFRQKKRFFDKYPTEIAKIEGLIPNEEMKMLIKHIPNLVFHLKNPKQSYWKLVLRTPISTAFRFKTSRLNINSLCYENQIRLLKIWPNKIKYLTKQSQKLCWVALKTNYRVIEFIRKPSLSQCWFVADRFFIGHSLISQTRIKEFLSLRYCKTWSKQQKQFVARRLALSYV